MLSLEDACNCFHVSFPSRGAFVAQTKQRLVLNEKHFNGRNNSYVLFFYSVTNPKKLSYLHSV